jgi:hypothetical protein
MSSDRFNFDWHLLEKLKMSLVSSLQRNFFDTAQYASQLFCKVKIRESMLFFIIKTEKFYAEKNKSYKIHMAYLCLVNFEVRNII